MAGIDTSGNASCGLKNPLDVGVGNLNKTQLEQCLVMLHDENRKEDVIKSSGLLAIYLGASLSAHSLIIFLGHIRPNQEDLPVSISALQFANTVRRIKAAKLKTQIFKSSPVLIAKDLQQKLDTLEQQMYLNSMVNNNDLSFNLSQDRVDQISHAVNDYIKDKATEINLLNVTDVMMALNVFRDICTKLEEEKEEVLNKLHSSKQSAPKTSIYKEREYRSSVKSLRKSSRKPSDVISRSSKHSRHSLKSNVKTPKTGLTLGHLLSANYQGDVAKSLIMKSKLIAPPPSPETPVASKKSERDRSVDRDREHTYPSMSDFNIPSDFDLSKMDSIWDSYKKDSHFNYGKINTVLEVLMKSCKNLLIHYNELIDKLNKTINIIDFKKYDLLKISLYQKMSDNIECVHDSVELKRMNESKEQLSASIVELMQNTIHIKEAILTLLAELNIMVQEYHRKKKEIMQDFSEYCIKKFQVKLPLSDRLLECIEDDLAILDTKETELINIPNPIENLFLKYQSILIRNQVINNNL